MGIWGSHKIRGTFLVIPIIRTIVFWGLHWGSLTLGNYHFTGDLWDQNTLSIYSEILLTISYESLFRCLLGWYMIVMYFGRLRGMGSLLT